jgi:hypothetical protein
VEGIESKLPAPPLSIEIAVPAGIEQSPTLTALPTGPGVFVFEDETGSTLALATTANLRRMVATRLEPVDANDGPTRRIHYRRLTRTIRAVPVGSSFEADWAYLQFARERVPTACKAALDRWQAWFVRCDAQAPFPQWTKTVHPGADRGTHLGPFPDKHTAGRYIELLEDAFDLCRYHQILVQSPNASACAYKEMGKCPAPCDGSISMTLYRKQIQAAINFGSTPIKDFRKHIEQRCSDAKGAGDHGSARRWQSLLDRTALSAKPSYAHVGPLQDFRMLAVMPSEHIGFARLFVILGGEITPLFDAPAGPDRRSLAELHGLVLACATQPVSIASEPAGENLALVCWHLFRPAKARQRGVFLKLNSTLTPAKLLKAMQSVANVSDQPEQAFTEHFIEDVGLMQEELTLQPHHGQKPHPHHPD